MKQSFLDKVLGRNKPKMSANISKKATMLASSVDNDKLLIEIFGDIGDWWLGNTAEDFLNLIDNHPNVSEIYVKLHSLGGYVTDGVAIYNALLTHPAKVYVTVVGMAGSICSVIAMAGDEISMLPASFIMIHNGQNYPETYKADDLEKAAAQLRQINSMAANIYAARSGLSLEQVTELMENETWMSAEKAVELGFADKVLPETPTDLSPELIASMSAPLPFATLDHLKHVPSALMSANRIQEKIIDEKPPLATQTLKTKPTGPNMTIEKTPDQIAAEAAEKAKLQTNQNDSVEIIQLCKMSGEKPERATQFIEAGNSAAEVRATLYAEKTKQVNDIPAVNDTVTEGQQVLSGADVQQQAATAQQDANPLLSFAKKMNSANRKVG